MVPFCIIMKHHYNCQSISLMVFNKICNKIAIYTTVKMAADKIVAYRDESKGNAPLRNCLFCY